MAKSYWIIPKNELLDGAILALKNADELYVSAKILFGNQRFVHALSIATLSLEEFGKHCILKEHAINNLKMDSKFWDEVVRKHEKKLNAIPNHLDQKHFPPAAPVVKKELERYRKYLLKLAKMKLEHLYVDWDSIGGKWSVILNSDSIKEKAKVAIETAHWTIEKYIEDVGWDRELLFTPHKELLNHFQKKKIHAFCNLCSTTMLDSNELLAHRKIFEKHDKDISWHYS